ncbi:N-acetylglucosamine kinase-like BadF-type ATPase [Caldalkalibacillus uzonensis]|uniref:N-acetylglucosamine kinase-like BadF-type ATPase n=1 Tax=Caldalkalibacillus uzonensis TaxID=353224 RepID=A0ABU0CV63_9BACI|nr:BadF/BadG/BcrA/BcrD ATPase family protein [Caldalkalibacillus uzonensis]MDQ0340017.1 N-acetylglucosamine kinase-like BadF-type ATPase [Caldalkalibacillus uzonensis]
MSFVLGIDGGGTKSTSVIADLKGKVLLTEQGGPTNIYAYSPDFVMEELKQLFDLAMYKTGLKLNHCAALCLGSAGLDRPWDRQMMTEMIRSLGFQGTILLTHDAETALEAGTEDGEGIIVISGTGSIGFGKTKEGRKARCGGWGHIIGDEGSGYDLGVKALKAAVRSMDGRGKPTKLLSLIREEKNLQTAEDFIRYACHTADKKEVASIARLVHQCYQAEDDIAKEILEEAAWELFLLADALLKQLHVHDRPFSVVVNGSILLNIPFIYEKFFRYVKENHPLARVQKLKVNAAYGAVKLALKALHGQTENAD